MEKSKQQWDLNQWLRNKGGRDKSKGSREAFLGKEIAEMHPIKI